MPEVALSFLGTTHPRALNLREGPELAKLKKFFKGIFITFTHRKGRKKIESIIPRGGLEQFEWNKDKNEGVVQTTTVQVRSALRLVLCIHMLLRTGVFQGGIQHYTQVTGCCRRQDRGRQHCSYRTVRRRA